MNKEEKISHTDTNDNKLIKHTEREKDDEKSNGLTEGRIETTNNVSTVKETNGKERSPVIRIDKAIKTLKGELVSSLLVVHQFLSIPKIIYTLCTKYLSAFSGGSEGLQRLEPSPSRFKCFHFYVFFFQKQIFGGHMSFLWNQ